jgi:two-component system, cell cycle response regulator CtrA
LPRYESDICRLENPLSSQFFNSPPGCDKSDSVEPGQQHLTALLVALTGNRSDDRIRALGLGADDAISQPVDRDELRARITSVARRHKGHSQSLLRSGVLSLSIDSREVLINGRPVKITGKEYLMLEILMLRKGQTVTKDMFLNHLYHGVDEADTKIIDVLICKLRRKLNAAGATDVIATVWGQGYALRVSQAETGVTDNRPCELVELKQRPVAPGCLPLSTWTIDRSLLQSRWDEPPPARIIGGR